MVEKQEVTGRVPTAPGSSSLRSPEPASPSRPLRGDDPSRDWVGGIASPWLPVITLWQPWASLIFSGHKPDETRGFRYPAKYHGQEVAIHSAAAFPALKHISAELHEVCYDAFGCSYNYSLPCGFILGTARLVDCVPTDLVAGFRTHDQLAAGDYSAGRFAWLLSEVRPLPKPIPAKGKQGWWKYPASGIVAATAGETRQGLDERSEQSPTGEAGDAQTPPALSHTGDRG